MDVEKYAETLKQLYEITHKKERRGFVYLLKSASYYKIGRTINVQKRVSNLSTATPHKIILVSSKEVSDCVILEAFLHSSFDGYRIRNTEWFKLPKEVVESVKILLGLIND